jgi:glutamine amidotransferase
MSPRIFQPAWASDSGEASSNPPSRPSKIGLVDYAMGNLRSVANALRAVGADPVVIERPEELGGIAGLVLPGVGAFGDCVRHLRERGLWDAIETWVKEERPFLGICLGYQVLFEESEEAPGCQGLGVFRGRVKRLPGEGLKVPHMGWNRLEVVKENPWSFALPNGEFVYFVHSFYPAPEDEQLVLSWTRYGVRFASAIASRRLIATQFHPEKSQRVGLGLLRAFVRSL